MDAKQKLQEVLFEHLDADLSISVKKKLGSTGAHEIVTSVVKFIYSHRQDIDSVLLDPTSSEGRRQKGSRFEPVEEPGFMEDLSKVE